MCVVDGRAKDKAVCLLGSGNQLVDHIVVKGATAIELAALAATDAIANRLGAQLKHLGLDALGVELLGDLGECAGRVAVCLGAAIDQKNLHHKLHLLSVNSAENYLTLCATALARCRRCLFRNVLKGVHAQGHLGALRCGMGIHRETFDKCL